MFTSINSRYNIMDTNKKIIKASGNINWRSSSKTSKFKKECRRGSHRSAEGLLSVSAGLDQWEIYAGLPMIIWEGCNQGVIKLYSRRGNTKASLKDLITVVNYNCLHKNHYNFWISGNSPIFLTVKKIKEIRTTTKTKLPVSVRSRSLMP